MTAFSQAATSSNLLLTMDTVDRALTNDQIAESGRINSWQQRPIAVTSGLVSPTLSNLTTYEKIQMFFF